MGKPGRMKRGRESQSRGALGSWLPLWASGIHPRGAGAGAVSEEPCDREGQGELDPLALISTGQSLLWEC